MELQTTLNLFFVITLSQPKLAQITLSMPDPQEIEAVIGYRFVQRHLLDEALLAAGASIARKDVHGPADGNKRLALVGDAALQMAILDSWYSTGSSIEEGSLLVRDFGSNNKLKDIAEQHGVDSQITMHPAQQGEKPRVTLASTIEAIIGAVWFDSGKSIETVQMVVKNLQC